MERECVGDVKKFVIPRGFGGKYAHIFAPVFPPNIRPLTESPWNGEAADPKVVPMCQNLQIAYKYFDLSTVTR